MSTQEPVTAALFANKAFADVKMKSYGVRVDPNPKTGDLLRRGRFGRWKLSTEGKRGVIGPPHTAVLEVSILLSSQEETEAAGRQSQCLLLQGDTMYCLNIQWSGLTFHGPWLALLLSSLGERKTEASILGGTSLRCLHGRTCFFDTDKEQVLTYYNSSS